MREHDSLARPRSSSRSSDMPNKHQMTMAENASIAIGAASVVTAADQVLKAVDPDEEGKKTHLVKVYAIPVFPINNR